jgi:hypothetical protein
MVGGGMVIGDVVGRDTSRKVPDWDGLPLLAVRPAPPPFTAVRYLLSRVRKRTALTCTGVDWHFSLMHSHHGLHGGQHVMTTPPSQRYSPKYNCPAFSHFL